MFPGERVEKGSLRVETYGTIDELDSALAMARAFVTKDEVRERIHELQKTISRLMADFASLGRDPLVTMAEVQALEEDMASIEEDLPEMHAFIVPGDTQGGAMLDHARTVARRAERCSCRLAKEAPIAESDRLFLNRVSDYCFLLMRLEEDVYADSDDE